MSAERGLRQPKTSPPSSHPPKRPFSPARREPRPPCTMLLVSMPSSSRAATSLRLMRAVSAGSDAADRPCPASKSSRAACSSASPLCLTYRLGGTVTVAALATAFRRAMAAETWRGAALAGAGAAFFFLASFSFFSLRESLSSLPSDGPLGAPSSSLLPSSSLSPSSSAGTSAAGSSRASTLPARMSWQGGGQGGHVRNAPAAVRPQNRAHPRPARPPTTHPCAPR